MGFYRQEYWGGLPFPSPGDLPDPGIKPRSPALQVDSLPSEPPAAAAAAAKSLQLCPILCDPMNCSPPDSSVHSPGKNTGVGSHSLLQGIFLIQGSNQGLPHCRQTLHCLSHEGSPSLSHPFIISVGYKSGLFTCHPINGTL